MISKSQARELTKVNKLFKGIPVEKLKLKPKGKTLFELDKSEAILQDHSSSKDIFLILTGGIKVGFEHDALGKREFTFMAGEFFSPYDFSDQSNRIDFSEAIEKSSLFRLDREIYDDLVKTYHRIRENLDEFNTDLQNRIAMKQFEAISDMQSTDDTPRQTAEKESEGSGFSFDDDFDTTLDDISLEDVQAEFQPHGNTEDAPDQMEHEPVLEQNGQMDTEPDEVENLPDHILDDLDLDLDIDTDTKTEVEKSRSAQDDFLSAFGEESFTNEDSETTDLLGTDDAPQKSTGADTSYLDDLTADFAEDNESDIDVDSLVNDSGSNDNISNFIERYSNFLLTNFHETLANIITFSNIIKNMEFAKKFSDDLESISDTTKTTIDTVNKALASWLDDSADSVRIEQMDASSQMKMLAEPTEKVKNALQQPINSILQVVEKIASTNIPANAKNVHQLLKQQTESLDRFVNLLISYLSDNITIDSTMYQLNESLDSILSRLAEYARGRDVKLLKRYDKDISVLFDPEDFYSACFQITKNACEAMPKGGRLLVSTHVQGENVIIRFKDSGHGIDPDIQETLFKPFVTSGKDEHLGLGLPLAKKIINDLSGNVSLGKQDNRGATFDITLTTF